MLHRLFTKSINNNKGFTIIETMIAVAIFVIVVMTGMDALLNANRIQQKSQDMRSILDNLSFIMEDMSRNIRTGYNIHCVNDGNFSVVNLNIPQSCSTGGAIAFENAYGDSNNASDQWVYKIESLDGGITFNISKSTDTGATWVQLNPAEVVINSVSSFSVLGAEPPVGDSQQPLVTIRLSGKIVLRNNVISPFSLQTSVAQRLVDSGNLAIAGGSVTYKYIRFTVANTKTEPTSGCTQMSEFTLLSGGSAVAWPVGSNASTGGSFSASETPSKVIDGDLNSKLCDQTAVGAVPMVLTIDTLTGVTFDGYKYGTANDLPDRDPVDWTLEGSNDNVSWTTISTKSGQSITNNRNTYTQDFSF